MDLLTIYPSPKVEFLRSQQCDVLSMVCAHKDENIKENGASSICIVTGTKAITQYIPWDVCLHKKTVDKTIEAV